MRQVLEKYILEIFSAAVWTQLNLILSSSPYVPPEILKLQCLRTFGISRDSETFPSLNYCQGVCQTFQSSLCLLCVAGFPQPVVTWQRKNGPLDAGAVSLLSGSLWIRTVSLQHRGTFSCTATNIMGNSTASTVLQVYGGFHTQAVHNVSSCTYICKKYTHMLRC